MFLRLALLASVLLAATAPAGPPRVRVRPVTPIKPQTPIAPQTSELSKRTPEAVRVVEPERPDASKLDQTKPADPFTLPKSTNPHHPSSDLLWPGHAPLRFSPQDLGPRRQGDLEWWKQVTQPEELRAAPGLSDPTPTADVERAAGRRAVEELAVMRAAGGGKVDDGYALSAMRQLTAVHAELISRVTEAIELVTILTDLQSAVKGDGAGPQLKQLTERLRWEAREGTVAERLPDDLNALRDVITLQSDSADAATRTESLSRLRQYFGRETAGAIAIRMSAKAFASGKAADARKLFDADAPPEVAAAVLRDLKAVITRPAEGAAPADAKGVTTNTPRGPPPGLQPLIPEEKRGAAAPVRESVLSDLPALRSAELDKALADLRKRIEPRLSEELRDATAERDAALKQATALVTKADDYVRRYRTAVATRYPRASLTDRGRSEAEWAALTGVPWDEFTPTDATPLLLPVVALAGGTACVPADPPAVSELGYIPREAIRAVVRRAAGRNGAEGKSLLVAVRAAWPTGGPLDADLAHALADVIEELALARPLPEVVEKGDVRNARPQWAKVRDWDGKLHSLSVGDPPTDWDSLNRKAPPALKIPAGNQRGYGWLDSSDLNGTGRRIDRALLAAAEALPDLPGENKVDDASNVHPRAIRALLAVTYRFGDAETSLVKLRGY